MPVSEPATSVLATLSNDLAAAVQQAGESVVAVHGRQRLPASGLVWDATHVVTADHVLERDTNLSITGADGHQRDARVVGRDVGSDLAILAVEHTVLQPIGRAAKDDTLAPGQLVLAIGRPGTPQPVASFGAISSLGGPWRTARGGVVDSYIRADVALLPGLSGGALADVQGRVIGLLSAHLAGGEPVALPLRTVESLVQRVLSGGSTRRAYLGVSTQPVDLQEGLRSRLHLAQEGGLMLLGVEPHAPADRGGLLPGDIVLAIGGRTTEDGEALQMGLGPDVVGTPVPIRFIRGGELRAITLTPAARPD